MEKLLSLGLSGKLSIDDVLTKEKAVTSNLTDKIRSAIRPSLRKAIYTGIASAAILIALESYTQGYDPTQDMLKQGLTASHIREDYKACLPFYPGGEIAKYSAYVQARAGSEIALFEQKVEEDLTLLNQYFLKH